MGLNLIVKKKKKGNIEIHLQVKGGELLLEFSDAELIPLASPHLSSTASSILVEASLDKWL